MTNPDRLAAAVAQGHEDAVQAWPQEDGPTVAQVNRLLGVWLWDAPSFRADVRIDFHEDGRILSAALLNPAPVSSPAGEDVERVARWVQEASLALQAATTINERMHRTGVVEGLNLANHDRLVRQAPAVLAALSARPVEAQEGRCDVLAHHAEIPVRRAEVERLAEAVASVTPCSCSAQRGRAEAAEAELGRLVQSRAELADEVHKLRERVLRIPDRLQSERDAALARAATAEALVREAARDCTCPVRDRIDGEVKP